MPGKRALAIVAFLLVALLPAAAHAQSYDGFDEQTLNANAQGEEIGTAASAQEVFITPEFDTAAYTVQSGERGPQGSDHTTCGGGAAGEIFGGRTAWVRFVSRVAGEVDFRADTPGYDSVAWVNKGPRLARNQSTFNDILNIDCADAVQGNGGERVVEPIQPHEVFHLQVAGVCVRGAAPPSTTACPNPDAAPGGPTRMRVIFTPYNRDGDGVADTLDSCPDAQGPVENSGCATPTAPPDRDGDRIADSEDDCIGQPGPPRDRPRNGCPDGGTLPGELPDNCSGKGATSFEFPGVLIEGGAQATNDPNVTLAFSWPLGTNEIAVSNTNIGGYQRFGLTRCVQWPLVPAVGRAEARVVHVRFLGPGVSNTPYQSLITLDPVRPKVLDAEVEQAGRNRRRVLIAAADPGSGIAELDIRDRRGRIKLLAPCGDPAEECDATRAVTATLRGNRRPTSIVAIDAAGNESARTTFQSTSCPDDKGYVRKGFEGTRVVCFFEGRRCKKKFGESYRDAGFSCRGGKLRR